MMERGTKRELYLKWWVILSGYMLVASLVTHLTLTDRGFHFHDPESRVAFSKMVYGEAQKPFVYRAFVPSTVRVLTFLTPEFVKRKLESVWSHKASLKQYGYEGKFATEYTWGIIIIFLALIGFAFCIRRLIAAFYDLTPLVSYFASVVALASVVLLRSFFVYDYPNLFLFSLCLVLMIERNWRLYYPIFIAACFTKETAVLLPFILLLNRSLFDSRKTAAFHIVVQCIIWIAATLLLRHIFIGRPGDILEFHLFDYNLPLLTAPAKFLQFSHSFLPRGLNIALVGLVAALTWVGWRAKPLFLRRSLLIIVPLVGLALLFGWVDETRMYYEALPILFCLCFHTVAKLFSEPLALHTDRA
jgi:hypothetical protein